MRKYLYALLALTLITAGTSTVKAGLSQECVAKIEATAQEVEKKSFQEVLNGGKWEDFKKSI